MEANLSLLLLFQSHVHADALLELRGKSRDHGLEKLVPGDVNSLDVPGNSAVDGDDNRGMSRMIGLWIQRCRVNHRVGAGRRCSPGRIVSPADEL